MYAGRRVLPTLLVLAFRGQHPPEGGSPLSAQLGTGRLWSSIGLRGMAWPVHFWGKAIRTRAVMVGTFSGHRGWSRHERFS